MERSHSNESFSNKSEDSSSREEPVVDDSGGSSDERDQKMQVGPAENFNPVDEPSSSASESTRCDDTISEEKLASPMNISLESEEVTEPNYILPLAFKDTDEPTILHLPEIELIAISSRIAEANKRYIEQLGEDNLELYEADDILELEEAVRRPAEARQHEELEQRDSVLAESGAESLNIAQPCVASGNGANGRNEEEINLRRSRVVIGLLKNEFVFFQQLRFNAELLMQFLIEKRIMREDDKQKYNDHSSSPSMPKFSLRPHVPGIIAPMDQLQPILANFIGRTRDITSKYRMKAPDCDENALKDYLDLFFDLQERLENLEDHIRYVLENYTLRTKIHREIAELVKQSRVLHRLVVHSHFKLEKVLYKYRIRIREMGL